LQPSSQHLIKKLLNNISQKLENWIISNQNLSWFHFSMFLFRFNFIICYFYSASPHLSIWKGKIHLWNYLHPNFLVFPRTKVRHWSIRWICK
jgi:hypothetical protein